VSQHLRSIGAFSVLLSTLVFFGGARFTGRTEGKADEDPDLTAGFRDSAHHWYDIRDEARVIDPLPDQQRYRPGQVREIADNVLLYQRSNGGWPKNYDMRAILSSEQRQAVERSRGDRNTTFDNGATHEHVQFLARAYGMIRDERYRAACLRGIEFILSARYPNGGWPQFFPDTSGYRRYVTFNDGAMTGVLRVLQRITARDSVYAFVGAAQRDQVQKAFSAGVECVLRCQILQNGLKTAWCQQYDHRDLRPRNARSFEPAAICSMESAELVIFLMSISTPSADVVDAVQNAVAWFDRVRLRGMRMQTVEAPVAQYMYHRADFDRIIVQDPDAPPLWPRFTELGTGRPLFCNRDGKPVYSLAEVDRERRTGYAWYTEEPSNVLKSYPHWQKEWAPDKNVLQ
jgi:PelA/Pel-15E family pectate lyase